jgi:ABC-type sugar transport system permease subunit
MIIFLAAILDVPQHLHESAQLDGAARSSGCAG